VPKGVDVERFRPTGSNLRAELGLDGKRVILSVARFVPIKNVTLLVEAMSALAQRDALAHLLLVGEGPELRNLRGHVDRLGLQQRVTFAGHVRHDQLGPFYRTADLFALGSEFDNSPNVVLEAMACGLAVVATDVGGVAEYVAAGRGGELVPARDVSALANALGLWLEDAPRRREAAAFNRQRMVQQFSWRVSAERLLDVYNRVLAAHQQQTA
jgi:glycosyltransferase involved in cell wall biosynthesis